MTIKVGSVVEILHFNSDFKGKLAEVYEIGSGWYPYHVRGLLISPTPYTAAFTKDELKLVCEEIDRG